MPLTDTRLRALKPKDKPYKVTDERGLYVEVTPTGSKLWRFRYRIGGAQKKLCIGSYSKEEVTAHGLRATASTFLNESGLWNPDAIERALAHGDSNVVRGIYHRGKHWEERVRMAQWWSDYLDELRTGGKVIMGKFAKG